MDQFSRIVVGYHGCDEEFARDLLFRNVRVSAWQPSRNRWDWLGHGIYFWEYSPSRAFRWAQERFAKSGKKPAVIGALIHLGRCFDLLDESLVGVLSENFRGLEKLWGDRGLVLPTNSGSDWKRRERDCIVINDYLSTTDKEGVVYDTVRGAFLEGKPAYPGAGFSRESHVQVAVRTKSSILGVFRPQ